MPPSSEIHSSPRQIQADALEDRCDELEQAQEGAVGAVVPANEEELPEYHRDSDGKTWSSDWTEDDWQEYDPVAAAQLANRTIAQFSRHHYRMSPEQHAERRRRWAAKHAERARAERARARGGQACRAHPTPTPVPRSRTVRPRRLSTQSHATADPTPPPPERAPATLEAMLRSMMGDAFREELLAALREVLPLLREMLGREREQASPATEVELMTVAQVAQQLRVSEPTVRRWISKGELPAARIGPRCLVRVRRADVEKFLDSVRQKSSGAPDDLDARATKIVSRARTKWRSRS